MRKIDSGRIDLLLLPLAAIDLIIFVGKFLRFDWIMIRCINFKLTPKFVTFGFVIGMIYIQHYWIILSYWIWWSQFDLFGRHVAALLDSICFSGIVSALSSIYWQRYRLVNSTLPQLSRDLRKLDVNDASIQLPANFLNVRPNKPEITSPMQRRVRKIETGIDMPAVVVVKKGLGLTMVKELVYRSGEMERHWRRSKSGARAKLFVSDGPSVGEGCRLCPNYDSKRWTIDR